MYESIQGTIAYFNAEYLSVEVGGLFYKVYVPVSFFSPSVQIEAKVHLFTSFLVRDHDVRLYGFDSREQRDLFELLISLSGIGAKGALSILGHLSFKEFRLAVTEKDSSVLCRIPGIGKKSAERLIIELKDRLKLDGSTSKSQYFSDAVLTLVRLGYSEKIAKQVIEKVLQESEKGNKDLSSLITCALKQIGLMNRV